MRAFYLPALLPLVGLSVAQPVTDSAGLTQKAVIKVHNGLDQPTCNVTVIHKYADLLRKRKTWNLLAPQQTSNETMTVDFEAGQLSFRYDWWQVTWASQNGQVVYYMDPSKPSTTIDSLQDKAAYFGTVQGVGSVLIAFVNFAKAAFLASSTAIAPGLAPLILAGSAFYAGIGGGGVFLFADYYWNSNDTSALIRHTLDTEDADALTTIRINPDYTVSLESPSGTSTYGVSNFTLALGSSNASAPVQLERRSGRTVA